jgi:hypothetical protein
MGAGGGPHGGRVGGGFMAPSLKCGVRGSEVARLGLFGACRFRFCYGVLPRCSVCPLFDAERAIRDVFGENPFPAAVREIALDPTLRRLQRGELRWQVPDFPPETWPEPTGEQPPG